MSESVRYTQPTAYQSFILAGLQSKSMYQGTASPWRVATRRLKNRVARKSRRINRLRGV